MSDYGHDLEFGVFITPSNEHAAGVVELAEVADNAGLDLVSFQDHPYHSKYLDTWTLFSNLPPEDEDGLVATTRSRLAGWQSELKGFAPLAVSKHHPGLAVIDGATSLIGKHLAIADSFEFVDALVKGRDSWLDLADDAHDVTSFYKTQRPTWQRLLDALERYADNRDALEKDIKAAVALGTLESIRDNPTPWGLVSQIEPLIATVDTLNEALAQGEREHALLSIDAKIAALLQALDATHADGQ